MQSPADVKLPGSEADVPKKRRRGAFSHFYPCRAAPACGLKSKNPSASQSFSVRAALSVLIFAQARHKTQLIRGF